MFWVLIPASASAEEDREINPSPPWSWSMEDRMAQRMNPQRNAERWTEYLAANADRERSGNGTRILIDGSRDPGLFLPGELLNHLLSTAFAADIESRDAWRRQFESRLGKPLPEDFWADIEAEAQDYLEAEQRIREVAKGLSGADASERDRILAQIDVLQAPQCQSRRELLASYRSSLGAEFDRFLYVAVAPGLRMTSAATQQDLEFREGGCQ